MRINIHAENGGCGCDVEFRIWNGDVFIETEEENMRTTVRMPLDELERIMQMLRIYGMNGELIR